MKRAAFATSVRYVSSLLIVVSSKAHVLTGHRLHLNLALAICEKEQLVPVRDVKSWPDFCGPQVAGSALEALGDVQVPLFALIPAQSVDTLRMHAGIGRPSEANSWNLAHIGEHRRIHMILLGSAAFVVVHLVCVARGGFFAPGAWVGAGGVL